MTNRLLATINSNIRSILLTNADDSYESLVQFQLILLNKLRLENNLHADLLKLINSYENYKNAYEQCNIADLIIMTIESFSRASASHAAVSRTSASHASASHASVSQAAAISIDESKNIEHEYIRRISSIIDIEHTNIEISTDNEDNEDNKDSVHCEDSVVLDARLKLSKNIF